MASSIERCVELQREFPTEENLPPPSIIQQSYNFWLQTFPDYSGQQNLVTTELLKRNLDYFLEGIVDTIVGQDKIRFLVSNNVECSSVCKEFEPFTR